MPSRKPETLTTDAAIDAAIGLLTQLTAARGAGCSRADLTASLGITSAQLDDLLGELESFADNRTGTRIAIAQDRGEVMLTGDAGQLSPLRLNTAEAIALSQVLTRCHLDKDVRDRVRRALDPLTGSLTGDRLLAGDPLFGGFFPIIAEAMAIGARMVILYLSVNQTEARERLIDPDHIEVSGDAAYLVAWDIRKDEPRTYRLDRVAGAELTDDSVVPHMFPRGTITQNLLESGQRALVTWASEDELAQCEWLGIQRGEAKGNPDGSVTAPVRFTSELWLFDHVLAAGGSIVIEGPAEVRKAFTSYAKDLLNSL